jgi:hypothetical protein
MKKNATCPKCHLALEGEGISCAECGWSERAEAARRKAAHDPQRFQCSWEADGLRCRYPGTISRRTHGGPHYCRWHIDCDDPLHGAHLVHESQSYQAENPEADFQLTVAHSLKQYGVERHAGESAADYTRRLEAFCREGILKQRQKQTLFHGEPE